MTKFLVPLGLFILIAVFLAVGLNLNPREVPSPFIGKPAPAFTAPLLDKPDQQRTRDDLLGKVWVLNVFASWCPPCRQEHPLFVAYAKRPGAPTLIGLNNKDKREDATRWLASLGNPYADVLFDPEGRISIDFGVYGVPETFVIDKAGIVRFKHVGPITVEVLDGKIDPLVRQLGG